MTAVVSRTCARDCWPNLGSTGSRCLCKFDGGGLVQTKRVGKEDDGLSVRAAPHTALQSAYGMRTQASTLCKILLGQAGRQPVRPREGRTVTTPQPLSCLLPAHVAGPLPKF